MIQVNHLEKSFEGFHALKGVDMHVEKGAIYGLVERSRKIDTDPPYYRGV